MIQKLLPGLSPLIRFQDGGGQLLFVHGKRHKMDGASLDAGSF
jgi:hypothetical protein